MNLAAIQEALRSLPGQGAATVVGLQDGPLGLRVRISQNGPKNIAVARLCVREGDIRALLRCYGDALADAPLQETPELTFEVQETNNKTTDAALNTLIKALERGLPEKVYIPFLKIVLQEIVVRGLSVDLGEAEREFRSHGIDHARETAKADYLEAVLGPLADEVLAMRRKAHEYANLKFQAWSNQEGVRRAYKEALIDLTFLGTKLANS